MANISQMALWIIISSKKILFWHLQSLFLRVQFTINSTAVVTCATFVAIIGCRRPQSHYDFHLDLTVARREGRPQGRGSLPVLGTPRQGPHEPCRQGHGTGHGALAEVPSQRDLRQADGTQDRVPQPLGEVAARTGGTMMMWKTFLLCWLVIHVHKWGFPI